MVVINNDIVNSNSKVQIRLGQKSSGKAAIHVMMRVFKSEEAEAVLLVHALLKHYLITPEYMTLACPAPSPTNQPIGVGNWRLCSVVTMKISLKNFVGQNFSQEKLLVGQNFTSKRFSQIFPTEHFVRSMILVFFQNILIFVKYTLHTFMSKNWIIFTEIILLFNVFENYIFIMQHAREKNF